MPTLILDPFSTILVSGVTLVLSFIMFSSLLLFYAHCKKCRQLGRHDINAIIAANMTPTTSGLAVMEVYDEGDNVQTARTPTSMNNFVNKPTIQNDNIYNIGHRQFGHVEMPKQEQMFHKRHTSAVNSNLSSTYLGTTLDNGETSMTTGGSSHPWSVRTPRNVQWASQIAETSYYGYDDGTRSNSTAWSPTFSVSTAFSPKK